MSRSYLDALSGQPLHEQAQAAFAAFSARAWADPSQSHHEGRLSAQILQAARETVAAALEIRPAGVSFHAIDDLPGLAVGGIAAASKSNANTSVAITSVVERDLVLRALDVNFPPESIIALPVSSTGRVEASGVAAAISNLSGTSAAVVLQVGNTEVGTLQPLAEVIAVAADHDVPVVTDATGAVGLVKIPPGWSALFANAATWAGPAGVGVLAIAQERHWQGPLPTDSVDVPSAASAAAALDAVIRTQPQLSQALFTLTERVRDEVCELLDDVDLLGDAVQRLPQVVTFSVLYADGERLASELDRCGVAVGSGSACASRAGLPSHVLSAIGALTHGNVRISVPIDARSESIDRLLAVLPTAVSLVRAEAGAQ